MKPFKPDLLTYFYLSRPAPCPYLDGREEQMVFTDLATGDDPHGLHNRLSRAGFRRSQGIAYKPNCQGCEACVPVRVPVAEFQLTRSFRRILKQNKDIAGLKLPPVAGNQHYEVFRRYIESRHGNGGMAAMTFDDYASMVKESPVLTRLIEFRNASGGLYGACLTDVLDDGLSLVYSFFEPEVAGQSPGSFIILWHMEEARRLSLPYVYLGYWIEGSPKMEYKTRFRPYEILTPSGWSRRGE